MLTGNDSPPHMICRWCRWAFNRVVLPLALAVASAIITRCL